MELSVLISPTGGSFFWFYELLEPMCITLIIHDRAFPAFYF